MGINLIEQNLSRPFGHLNRIDHHPVILIIKTETQIETLETTYSGKETETNHLLEEIDPLTHL